MDGDSGDIVLDELICDVPEKYFQWRMTVNKFREREYLHLRKYFLSFEGEYIPSREGACIEVDIQRLANIFSALTKLLSDAEALESVLGHIDDETAKRLLTRLTKEG
jgi:hypothetical protein